MSSCLLSHKKVSEKCDKNISNETMQKLCLTKGHLDNPERKVEVESP